MDGQRGYHQGGKEHPVGSDDQSRGRAELDEDGGSRNSHYSDEKKQIEGRHADTISQTRRPIKSLKNFIAQTTGFSSAQKISWPSGSLFQQGFSWGVKRLRCRLQVRGCPQGLTRRTDAANANGRNPCVDVSDLCHAALVTRKARIFPRPTEESSGLLKIEIVTPQTSKRCLLEWTRPRLFLCGRLIKRGLPGSGIHGPAGSCF